MSEVFHLPKGSFAYDTLLSMLKGYLKAGAEQEYVRSGEAAEKIGIPKANLSRNVNFFVDFGFLQREEGKKSGGCKLVSEAAEFVSIYNVAPNELTSRQKLGEILKKNQVVSTCLKRLESGNLATAEFYAFILTETTDRKADPNNLKIFTDLLIYSTLLKQDDDYFMLPKESEVPELPEKVSRIRQRKGKKEKGEPQRRGKVAHAITQFPPFLISITQDTPRNKIKDIVTAVLEAIDEYKKKVGKR